MVWPLCACVWYVYLCVCVCVYGWTGSLLLWSSTIFLLSVGSSMNGALLTIYWGSVTSRWRNHPPTVGKPGPTMRPKRPLFRQFSPATGTQDPPRPEIALRSSQTRKIAPKIRENPQFWFRVWSSGFHRPVLPTALILGQKRQNSPIKFPSAEHKFWNSWQILKNHHIFSHQITDNSVWKQELVLGATFPLKPTLFQNWPVFFFVGRILFTTWPRPSFLSWQHCARWEDTGTGSTRGQSGNQSRSVYQLQQICWSDDSRVRY